MNEVIRVKQLSKSYGGLSAMQDLNLSVMQGTVFGLLGQTVQEKVPQSNVC